MYSNHQFSLWITITILGLLANHANTLRLSLLFVPSELIVPSETTWLNCTYDLENDHLYAIQWYKIINGKAEEFYRYMPEQYPSVTIYEMPGVYVDERLSKNGNVFLNRTDLKTFGIYRCEVSADSPSFQTVRREAEMRVFQLPQIGPIIKQLPAIDKQSTNHQLLACTAINSKPYTELSWFINGFALSEFEEYGAKLINSTSLSKLSPAKTSHPIEEESVNNKINHFNLNNNVNNYFNVNENDNQMTVINNPSQDGLSNSSSQLLIDINAIADRLRFLTNLMNKNSINQNLQGTSSASKTPVNQLMITCKGQITNHLEQSTELRINDYADQLTTAKDLNEHGPIMSGAQHSYRRNEQLELNCTSTKSKSAAELIWLINDRPALEYKNTRIKHFRPIQLTDTEFVWRSSLNVALDDQLFVNSNTNGARRFSGLKYDRKQMKVKCKSIIDKTIDVGNAVHLIDLVHLLEHTNELNKQSLPARHNRSANIIWPIFTGEIVIGLFIVSILVCIIKSVTS